MDNTVAVSTLLIVEDHMDAAAVLHQVAAMCFPAANIESTASVGAALKLLQHQRYSLAIIDIGLPDGSGIDIVRFIHANHSQCLSLVTTIFDDDNHLFEALRAGAAGYLLKGYSAIELQQYLLDVVAGKPALSPAIAQSMLQYFRGGELATATEASAAILTKREVQILGLIAKGSQVKEVGEFLAISKNTVAQHVKSLYKKLNVRNRAEATAAALSLNIINPQ